MKNKKQIWLIASVAFLIILRILYGFFSSSKYHSNHIKTQSIQFVPENNLESTVNSVLWAKYGKYKWRVIKDSDSVWNDFDKDYFLQSVKPMIEERRIKDPYYPFIVCSDFNGDGIKDCAALVFNTQSGKEMLAIIHGGSNEIFWSDKIADYLTLFPKSTMSSVWEKKSVVLIGDGIEVEKDASSSWVLYWTGNGYDTYFTSD